MTELLVSALKWIQDSTVSTSKTPPPKPTSIYGLVRDKSLFPFSTALVENGLRRSVPALSSGKWEPPMTETESHDWYTGTGLNGIIVCYHDLLWFLF